MSFGKFKGEHLSDVPVWYLRWISQQEWLKEPLLSAVQDILDGHYQEEREPPARSKPISVAIRKMAGEVVEAGYRSLSKKHHPDCGGEHQAMVNLNQAVDWLRDYVDP